MVFNGNENLVIGIRRKKPSKGISFYFTECPFDIYEILINPVDYEICIGDEAIVLAMDFEEA